MAKHEGEVWDLIRALHGRYEINDVYDKCLSFKVACLRAIEDALPPRALESLDVAERFCEGRASVGQLKSERERLWKYLHDNDLAYSFENRKARLLRATLCALYDAPSEDEDIYQTLEWFLDMLDANGQYAKLALKLLEARFAAS